MDITQELLKLSQCSLSDVLNSLKKEQLISEKKRYLFEVISFTQQMIELAPTCIQAGCEVIKMSNVSSMGRVYSIELSPKTAEGKMIIHVRDTKGNFFPWFNDILATQPKFEINSDFTNDFGKSDINLHGDIQAQMYEVLLSNELLATLNYSKLSLGLGSKNITHKAKKI